MLRLVGWTRALRSILRPLGWYAVRLPGPDRDILLMPRHTVGRVEHVLLELHLVHLLRVLDVNCVLDVGANQGQYGLELRHAGYDGHIVSFEPVPDCFEALRLVAMGDPRWTAHPWALGTEDGSARINIAARSGMSSFLTPNAYAHERFGALMQTVGTVDVPVRRLEAVLDEVTRHIESPRLFLKMDTQGYDLEVFGGLGAAGTRLRGLQSEVSALPIYAGMPGMSEALSVYRSHGFALTGMFPVSRDERSLRVIEFDCVMARA
jgi:FkbM family methyltransferase